MTAVRKTGHDWAALIRLIDEVNPVVCPRCGGTMWVIALIQEPKVIDKILKHVRTKGRDARAGPWATGLPDGATRVVGAWCGAVARGRAGGVDFGGCD